MTILSSSLQLNIVSFLFSFVNFITNKLKMHVAPSGAIKASILLLSHMRVICSFGEVTL